MLFRRTLRRELGGGFAIVAQRDFEIRFQRVAGGFQIGGRQVAVTVDAPPSLEAYARLEREREEDGMFPLVLNERGLIRFGPEGLRPDANIESALELAMAQLSGELAAQDEREQARSFILGLQRAAGTLSSAMPVDLFVPPETIQRASRRIDLPDGTGGSLSTEFSGTIAPDSGLLADARRVIVTETGGSRRETDETWTLHSA
jgi:hypothetical protein